MKTYPPTAEFRLIERFVFAQRRDDDFGFELRAVPFACSLTRLVRHFRGYFLSLTTGRIFGEHLTGRWQRASLPMELVIASGWDQHSSKYGPCQSVSPYLDRQGLALAIQQPSMFLGNRQT